MSSDARNTKGLRPATVQGKALTLLNAQNTTGVGNTYWLGHPYTVFGLSMYRATTGAAGASTKPSIKIEGALDNSSNALWYTIGAATRNPTKTPGALSTVTSTAPILGIRATINAFSTSSSTSAPDKVAVTVIVAPQT